MSKNQLMKSAEDEWLSERHKGKKLKRFVRYLPLTIMALPALIYFLVNNYLPLTGLVLAFKDYNYVDGIFGSPWNGIENFKFLFATPNAANMIRNTLLYNLVFLVSGTIISIAIAILLNELREKYFPRFYQTALIMPYLLSWTVVGYVLYAFLNPDYGVLNQLLENVFLVEGISWYTKPDVWPYILVILNIWKTVGYTSVLYLASVVSIDESLYEAAVLDGANRWQRIRYVTIPSIMPTIITMFILSIGKICHADFGLFYQTTLNSGPLYSTTNVLDTYVYRTLIQTGDIGMSAAAGFLQSIVGFILVLGSNLLVKKIDNDKAMF